MSTFYQKFYAGLSRPFRERNRVLNACIFTEKVLVGVSSAAYLITVLYTFFALEITKKSLLAVLVCPAFCLVVVSLLRKIIKRKRPYEKGIDPLVKKDAFGNSFPSRHTACACVIAATVLPYSPVAGGVMFAVSAWIAFFRFLFGHHYFTDLFFGALLGIAFGAIGWL